MGFYFSILLNFVAVWTCNNLLRKSFCIFKMNLSVILVEAKNSGNIGAIARSMANFGFSKLILVNPKCNHLSQTARNRAKWGNPVLKKAKVVKKIPKIQTLVATTSKIGSDYNIPRVPISPAKLSSVCKGNIGLLFGRESFGLTNEEIQQADFVVSIPAKSKYPVLNLSHAVTILLYELSKEDHTSHIKLATEADKKQVLKLLKQKMKSMNFTTKEKKQTQTKVWKRMISKSFLTKREAFALMGFLKK
ncbi:TrmJ/YjtD family RNA methyltransferase [Candidatus Woesearchaeota archaeon]|nr:TrmJ/YjtD family RNA methyltransferase [Candidatus Woesearchaeota archaeon]